MARQVVAASLLLLSACVPGSEATPALSLETPMPTPELSPSAIPSQAPAISGELPDGFPIFPGARLAPSLQEEAIATWEADVVGSAVYDFYAEALPESGLPIVGLYPGGEAAIIRFEAPDGQVLQVLIILEADRTLIALRPDLP